MLTPKISLLPLILAILVTEAGAQVASKNSIRTIGFSGDRKQVSEWQREGRIDNFLESSPGEFLMTNPDAGLLSHPQTFTPVRRFTAEPVTGKYFAVVSTAADELLEFLRLDLKGPFEFHIDQPTGTLVLKISGSEDLARLTSNDLVLNILPAESAAREETALVEIDLAVNKVDMARAAFDVDGSGNAVSIKEKRFTEDDDDLKGRIFPSPTASTSFSSHANQMATLVAGAGNTNYTSIGAAPGSMVTSSGFENLFADDLRNLPVKVGVQNHSYGTGPGNFYGAEARSYDLVANTDPIVLHVFSSGNSGTSSGTGRYENIPGFSNLTGNFKMAKNSMVISSHYRDYTIDSRNSSGPAYDGRIKPELVAFGSDGTSDAAALVSGAALLLQQINALPNNERSPSALIRAAMVAGADEIGEPGPDFRSGFGALNAIRAARLLSNGQVKRGTVGPGGITEFRIELPAGISAFSAVLAWNDPAAQAGDIRALVNDLDLTVISPDQQIWDSWVLSSYPKVDSLTAAPVRKPDHLNNIEQVSIADPIAGEYVLRVSGTILATASQEFFLVWREDQAGQFNWTTPSSASVIRSGDPFYLRWESTITGAATLEVREAVTGDWSLLDPAVPLEQGWYLPVLPKSSSTFQFRMSMGGKVHGSAPIRFGVQPKTRVLYDCPDGKGFSWTADAAASAYRVLRLGERYLEPVTVTTDTIFRTPTTGLDQLFAIQPIYENGLEGIRSVGFDPAIQGVDCYFGNFSAIPDGEGAASISLLLSFRKEIESIILEKSVSGTFIPLEVRVPDKDLVQFHDPALTGGISVYRARLKRAGKPDILTYEAEVFYGDEKTCLVFPNPVTPGETLTVLSDGDQLEITFFDPAGKRMESMEVFGQVFKPEVRLDAVPGMYYYQVRRRGRPFSSGRILVAPR